MVLTQVETRRAGLEESVAKVTNEKASQAKALIDTRQVYVFDQFVPDAVLQWLI